VLASGAIARFADITGMSAVIYVAFVLQLVACYWCAMVNNAKDSGLPSEDGAGGGTGGGSFAQKLPFSTDVQWFLGGLVLAVADALFQTQALRAIGRAYSSYRHDAQPGASEDSLWNSSGGGGGGGRGRRGFRGQSAPQHRRGGRRNGNGDGNGAAGAGAGAGDEADDSTKPQPLALAHAFAAAAVARLLGQATAWTWWQVRGTLTAL
jgi:hypothetical protein